MHDFSCLSLTPIESAHVGPAAAAARAGGVALLDAEFCREEDSARAGANLERLLELAGRSAPVGLRLTADQVAARRGWLERLAARPHWLILAGWEGQALPALEASLPPAVARTLLLEVTDAAQLDALAGQTGADGLVARGHESGGWVGEDSAFILTQKLLARQARPVYVQGGVGPHAAAACRAAGAAGVVLDDQLWLMPESPLPAAWQAVLGRLSGQEAAVAGERLGAGCRFLARPNLKAAAELQQYAERAELEAAGGEEAAALWRERARAALGWGDPETRAWPVGQAVGLAAGLAQKYKTTGRLVQAMLKSTREQVGLAARLQPLRPGGPLAASHGTRYPVVQGPMTRVSDTAPFAASVARAGALPLLALALLKGEEVRPLLEETRRLVGELPWGVGILGFVPQELREQQLAAVREVRPPFALIAGGRPDQAAQLEALGVATYIHVPVPGLLKNFYAKGARRFVFEGRECGGHVGPLTSFVLWEGMIEALLEEVAPGEAEAVHVLFAGGIHDARSAAMVGAMAAPLAARGVRVGVLMGTAYLFTEEAVAHGAIVPGFQEQALRCERTTTLESGPGHAIRCVASPFTREFYSVRRRAAAAGRPPAELKEALESLMTGRLRIASKGLEREGGRLVAVEGPRQLEQGVYMIGQVATIQNSVRTMEGLHREVAEGGAELLRGGQAPAELPAERAAAGPSEIAIVGIATLLPGAQEPEGFWTNVVRKVDSITEVPPEHWDWRLYYDPERKARDKSYSKWGGFIGEVPFDPLRFGIPPNSLKSISCSQLITLECVRRALEDAGYAAGDFDRERTSVILGAAEGGMLNHQYVARTTLPLCVASPPAEIWERLPEWTEESFPGTITNVTAGRVANRFDLGGSNYTVDAACASSLTAVDLAVAELESGRSNVVITGGVDLAQSPHYFVAFSKTHALSPRGRTRTFDKSADGIVISEGVVILVLKRLADAERDGDRVYAVLKGVAGSSDGKGMGMTAPRPLGQARAVERACRKAGVRPSTIGYYEAHGTGTVVGDRAELETIITSLRADGAAGRSCAIGSAKTLVGHTKTAAGVVGLAKAALSLYHKTLPPHAGVEEPLDPIAEPQSPVYLLREARPWLADPDHPRRCGVSAFGFGGTNSHAVLEEYAGEAARRAPGGGAWPCELFVLAAESREALAEEARRLLDALERGAEPRPRDLAFTCAARADEARRRPHACLATVSEDLGRLKADLKSALAVLRGDAGAKLPPHVRLKDEPGADAPPLAFVFPGQGAQYPDMAREVALYFEEMRGAVEAADARLREHYPQLLSRYIYPPAPFTEAEQKACEQQLTDTHVAQPAIGAVSLGFLDIARRVGLRPSMLCGHSYGEYTALCAASAVSREEFLALSEARGRVMAEAEAEGAMAVVLAPRAEVAARLGGGAVVVANDNAPRQTVISGPRAEVAEAVERLKAAGVSARLLPVSGPFHSPLMAPAEGPLSAAIEAVAWAEPLLPVYSNVGARPYPADPGAVRRQLSAHLLSPVEFVGQVERMYEDGARAFLELGPKGVLTSLIGQILEGREHLAVSVEGGGGGLRGLLSALGALAARGVGMDVAALFAGRDVRQLDLQRLVETTKRPAPPPHAWILSGAGVRPQSEPAARAGRLPLLTKDSSHNGSHADEAAEDTATKPAAPTPPPAEALVPSWPAPAPAGDGRLLAAYQAYQETMRQFLSLQEEALKHFLGVQQPAAVAGVGHPAFAAPPALPPPAPEPAGAARPNGNGNGGPSPHAAQAPAAAAKPSGNGLVEAPAGPNAPAGEGRPEGQAAPAVFGRASLIQTVVRIVSDRTGYPAEMLGLGLDLEAELGIDSIKRIEILEELQRALPPALAADMQERMEQFTKVKSLDDLVGILLPEGAGGDAPAAAEPARPAPAPPQVTPDSPPPARAEQLLSEPSAEPLGAGGDDDGAEAGGCPRSLIEAWEEELPDGEPLPLAGLYLVTEDRLGVAEHVAGSLREAGARAAVIGYDALASPPELERRVAELQRLEGPIRGVVHLAPLEAAELPATLSAWRGYTQAHAKSLFRLLRLCAAEAAAEGRTPAPRVLSASLLGGLFGRGGQAGPGLPTGGSGYGLLKTVEIEWPGAVARAVDFDAALPPREVAARVVRELTAPEGTLEVGYPGGRRTVFRTARAPLDTRAAPPRLRPDADWVVLVTGGARGITAEAARAFAVPGMRMVVVGRAPEPEAEEADTAGVEDVTALRRVLIERARASGGELTPARIEAQVGELLRRRAIHRNLRRLAGAGVRVEYHALDVRDEEAFGGLLAQTYARHGRLDAVLHGAGVIEDKLLADKTPDSFDRVFDTKADSAFLLSRHLDPASLKLLVFFSSVAGRYGNRGQGDYAAANEVMSRFAWRLAAEFPRARVVAIEWGPWGGTGMASAAVNQQFRERGVVPIGTRAGCRFFTDEVMYGARSEAEVVAGEGPWTAEGEPACEDLGDLFLNIGALTENFWMM